MCAACVQQWLWGLSLLLYLWIPESCNILKILCGPYICLGRPGMSGSVFLTDVAFDFKIYVTE